MSKAAVPLLWLVAGSSALGQPISASAKLLCDGPGSEQSRTASPGACFDDDFSAVLGDAYATNPALAARRYDQRAIEDDVGIALSLARPNVQFEVEGGYRLTLPGATTQLSRPLSDQLNSTNIERNDIGGQLVIDQPIWTGGRASTALAAANGSVLAGREALRAAEGDLIFDLIAAYADVRRDEAILAVRRSNVAALLATLEEVRARRTAGELTRTDIAQAELQLQSAMVQMQTGEAQLQASRASFAAIVGRPPGRLAPLPGLPGLPLTLDDALDAAERINPDLAQAVASEKASRARIGVAKAEGAPQLRLRGTAATTGPAVPFDTFEQDVTFAGRATLIVPLSLGGRVRSQIAQARNRNTADALRVEATRRQMVQGVVLAWNQWSAAEQNTEAQRTQLAAARTFLEGSLAEYRQGLRSTFDVLFAQNSLREAETALLVSRRDSYVARAALLRRTGGLELRQLLAGAGLADPEAYLARVRDRNAVPWGGLVRAVDGIGAPRPKASPPEDVAIKGQMVSGAAEPPPPASISDKVMGRRAPPRAAPRAPDPRSKGTSDEY